MAISVGEEDAKLSTPALPSEMPSGRPRSRNRPYHQARNALDVDRQAVKVQRLEMELQSLRDMYARKIASTELKCERMLQDKDGDMDCWYKDKRQEIAKFQAGVSVMYALFKKKQARQIAQMGAEKAEFERQKEEFQIEVQRLRKEHNEAMQKASNVQAESESKYQGKLQELRDERDALTAQTYRYEDQMSQLQDANRKLEEEAEKQRQQIESLRRKVSVLEQSEEMARRAEKIEHLEGELRRQKKTLTDQRQAEADALQKELMDYVKFIVHILPDDWQTQVAHAGGYLPPDLQGRTSPALRASPALEATAATKDAVAFGRLPHVGAGRTSPAPAGGNSGGSWRPARVYGPPPTRSRRSVTDAVG